MVRSKGTLNMRLAMLVRPNSAHYSWRYHRSTAVSCRYVISLSCTQFSLDFHHAVFNLFVLMPALEWTPDDCSSTPVHHDMEEILQCGMFTVILCFWVYFWLVFLCCFLHMLLSIISFQCSLHHVNVICIRWATLRFHHSCSSHSSILETSGRMLWASGHSLEMSGRLLQALGHSLETSAVCLELQTQNWRTLVPGPLTPWFFQNLFCDHTQQPNFACALIILQVVWMNISWK